LEFEFDRIKKESARYKDALKEVKAVIAPGKEQKMAEAGGSTGTSL
jgi:hypothetical protein